MCQTFPDDVIPCSKISLSSSSLPPFAMMELFFEIIELGFTSDIDEIVLKTTELTKSIKAPFRDLLLIDYLPRFFDGFDPVDLRSRSVLHKLCKAIGNRDLYSALANSIKKRGKNEKTVNLVKLLDNVLIQEDDLIDLRITLRNEVSLSKTISKYIYF
ncbi:hypothetical protein ACOME3_008503 [Neoechinorhynchus agilis]